MCIRPQHVHYPQMQFEMVQFDPSVDVDNMDQYESKDYRVSTHYEKVANKPSADVKGVAVARFGRSKFAKIFHACLMLGLLAVYSLYLHSDSCV